MGSIVSNHFRLQFSRNLSATDLTYMVQRASEVTGPWTNLLTYAATAGWVTNTPGVTVSESFATGSPPDQYVTVLVSETTTSSSAETSFTPPPVTIVPPPSRAFFRVLISL